MIQDFTIEDGLTLESGVNLPELKVRLSIHGDLKSGNPIVWVCHALTANANPLEWWPGVFGEASLIKPSDFTIICVNNLGSCYGTTGPKNLDFPAFTIRDMSKALYLVADKLALHAIDYLIGASMGGQIALEWSVEEPNRIKKLVLLATNARHSPWGIAFNETQRMVLKLDAEFGKGEAKQGLSAARAVAHLSYRSYSIYLKTQLDLENSLTNQKAVSYQNYQGNRLAERFNAYSYWYLSLAMDSHNIGRGRTSIEEALLKVQADTLIIGIHQDLLFPLIEQEFLEKHIRKARLQSIDSIYGHDGFLTETQAISQILAEFISSN